jgi:methylamine dehydrogenase heavy chain
MACLLAAPHARADEEATVATLPPSDGARLYIPDASLGHIADGHAAIVDGHGLRYLATLPLGFIGMLTTSRDASEIYIATTYYDRGNRGNRVDVLETYDASTLALKREAILPPKHAQAIPYQAYLAPSAHNRFLFVQNATPASSVTVVDTASNSVAAEIGTAGCFGIYPSPTDDGRFSSLCGDGVAVTIELDGAGHETARHESGKLFDPMADAVFIEAARWGDKLVFLSFLGNVHVMDMSGETVKLDAVWPIGAKGTWRPGGYQPFAADGDNLFVAMHQKGQEGSHKSPSDEVWQIDLRTRALKRRMQLPGMVAVAASHGGKPLLYTLKEADGALDAWEVADKPKQNAHLGAVAGNVTTLLVR